MPVNLPRRAGWIIAEVVLDAGEVLNTILGMGFITIGYAIEPVAQGSLDLDIIAKIRPAPPSIEESHKKASKVVDLAKRAIYQEISTPCDLTSAEKALILIAGPSHEMSMKGYMTVRKWIDRSIRGLEVRSGDYPVNSSHFLPSSSFWQASGISPVSTRSKKTGTGHKNPGVYDPDSTSFASRFVHDEYAGRDIVSEITEIAAGTRAFPGADPLPTDESGRDDGKDTDLHEKEEPAGLVSRQDIQTRDSDEDDFPWIR